MKKKKVNKKARLISTKVITIPLLLIVVVMHIIIVSLIFDINRSSNNLFDLMQRSGEYQIEATSIQSNNSVLTETSRSYIQNENPSFQPLVVYANELTLDRRSTKVYERFKTYDVSYDVLSCIEKAAFFSEQLIKVQLHAIAVMASVYPLPEIPSLEIFSNVQLTEEEQALSNSEKISLARRLINESSYSQLRYNITENVDNCNKILRDEFQKATTDTQHHVSTMRSLLWAEIGVIILVLSGAFVMFYLLIIKPLRNYSKNISSNQSIKNDGRISELRQLTDAFNGLWYYRNQLESILRTEAENDSLTGLPNRYCMEHDLLRKDYGKSSFGIVMFDVNFLKQTNDTKGHLAGDNLLRTAATCINECFGIEKLNNCYRIGGDEFIAFLPKCNIDDIKKRIDKFKLALIRENISVSVGYSFTDHFNTKDFKDLMEEADKYMYEQKKITHNIK